MSRLMFAQVEEQETTEEHPKRVTTPDINDKEVSDAIVSDAS